MTADLDPAAFLAVVAETDPTLAAGIRVLLDVMDECDAADAKHGNNRDLPDGTSLAHAVLADAAKADTDRAASDGTVTWMHVLNEEVCEAFAETDKAALRTELVQVAASAIRWILAIDTRETP